MKFNKNLKKIIFVIFCSIVSLCSGLFLILNTGDSNANVYAASTSSNGYKNIGDLLISNYSTASKKVNGLVLAELYKQITGKSNATFTTVSSLAPTSSQWGSKQVNAQTFRENNKTLNNNSYGNDIQLTFGGMEWTATELFKDSNGKTCLVLLKKDTDNSATFYWGKYTNTVAGNYNGNLYGTSFMRAAVLNNGGTYATSINTCSTTAKQTVSNTYAKFTMSTSQISTSVKDFLVTPATTYHQSYAVNVASTNATQFNDNWGNPANLTFCSSIANGKYSVTYGQRWKDDYVFLPGTGEIGRLGNSSVGSMPLSGRWGLSTNQFTTTNQYWLRTTANMDGSDQYGKVRTLKANGLCNASSDYSANKAFYIRPCIILNLDKLEENKNTVLTTPTAVSSVYTGSALTSKFTSASWYDSSKMTISYNTSLYDYTSVGNHVATVTAKSGYSFGTSQVTSVNVTLTITKAAVTSPVNRNYVYDGKEHKFEMESWYNSGIMEIIPVSTTYNYTDALVYEAKVKLKNTNYYFSGLSQNLTETSVAITITKKQITTPSNSRIVYDGSEHKFENMSWFDSVLMTLDYDDSYNFKDAGTYNVTVNLPNDNYRWSSADTKTIIVSFVIDKKEINIDDITVEYNGVEHKSDVEKQTWFTENSSVIAPIVYESSDFIDSGEYEFTVTLTDDNIIFSQNRNVRNMTFNVIITKKKVNVQDFTVDNNTGLLSAGESLQLAETIYSRDKDTDKEPVLSLRYSRDKGATWEYTPPTHSGQYLVEAYITNPDTSNYVLDGTGSKYFTKNKGEVYMPRFTNEDVANGNYGGKILPRTDFGWTTQICYIGREQVFKLLKVDGTEPVRINIDSVSGGMTYDPDTKEFRVTNVGVYTVKISLKDPENEQWDNQDKNSSLVRTITLEILKAEIKYEIVDDGQNTWEKDTVQTIVINFAGVNFINEGTKPKITVLAGVSGGTLEPVSESKYQFGENTLTISVDISSYQPDTHYEIQVLLDETYAGNNNYYLVSTGKTPEGEAYKFFIMTAVINNLKIEWLYSNPAISTGIVANPLGETFTYNEYNYNFKLNEMLLPSGMTVVYSGNEQINANTYTTQAVLTPAQGTKFGTNVVAIDPTTSEVTSNVTIITNADGTVTVKINWTINPMTYEITNLNWLEDFTYNQLKQTMDLINFPEWITKTTSNGTNTATNPGTYTAKYMLTADTNHIFGNSENNPLIEIQGEGKIAIVSHVWEIKKIVINVSNLILDWKTQEHYDINSNWFEYVIPTVFDQYQNQLLITFYSDELLSNQIELDDILVTLGEEVWFYVKVELKSEDPNVTDFYEIKNTTDKTIDYAYQMFKVGDSRDVIDLTLNVDSDGFVYNATEQKILPTYPKLNLDETCFEVKYYLKAEDGSYSIELNGEFPVKAGQYLAIISFVEGSEYAESYNIRNKRVEFEIHKLILDVATWTENGGILPPTYDVYAKNSDITNIADFFTSAIYIALDNSLAILPLQYNKLYNIVLSINDESVAFDENAQTSYEFRTGLDPSLDYATLEIPVFVENSFVWNNSEITFEILNWEYYSKYLEITSDSDSLTQRNANQYKITLRFKANASATWIDGTSDDLELIFNITKRVIDKPVLPEAGSLQFEFDGLNAEYFPDGFDSDWMLIEGNIQENIGSGTMTIKLLDAENMQWSDGTNDDLSDIAYTVVPRQLDRPIISQLENKLDYIYSGSVIEINTLRDLINFNPKFMTVTGDITGTNANIYSIVISLIYKEYTSWKDAPITDEEIILFVTVEDGDEGTTEQPSTSTDDIMLEWQIFKAPITGQWNTDGNYPVFIPDNESAKDLFSVKYYAVDANGEYILDENGNRIEVLPENMVEHEKYKAEIVLNDSDNYEVLGENEEVVETEKEFEYTKPVKPESFLDKVMDFVKKYWLWLLIALLVLILLIIIIVVAKKRKKKKVQEAEEKAKANEQQMQNPYGANYQGQFMPPPYPPYAGQPPMYYGGMQGYAQPQYGQQMNGYDAMQDKKLQELEDRINILSGAEEKPKTAENSGINSYDMMQDAKLKSIEERLAKLDGINSSETSNSASSHDEVQDKKLQELEEKISRLSQNETGVESKISNESLSDYDKMQDEKLMRIEKQLELLQKDNITQTSDLTNNLLKNVSSQDIEKFMLMLVQSYKNTKRNFNEDYENMINNRGSYDAGNWDRLKESERRADEEYNKERQRLEKIRDDIKQAEMEKAQREIEEQKKELERQKIELEQMQQKRQIEVDAKLKDAKQKLEEMDVRIQKQEAEAKKREEAKREAERKKEEKQLQELREERLKAEQRLQALKLENEKVTSKENSTNEELVKKNEILGSAIIVSGQKLSLQEAYANLTAKQKQFYNSLRDYATKQPNAKSKETKFHLIVGAGNNPYLKLVIKKNITVACFKLEDAAAYSVKKGEDVSFKTKETEIKITDEKMLMTAMKLIDVRVKQVEEQKAVSKQISKEKKQTKK